MNRSEWREKILKMVAGINGRPGGLWAAEDADSMGAMGLDSLDVIELAYDLEGVLGHALFVPFGPETSLSELLDLLAERPVEARVK